MIESPLVEELKAEWTREAAREADRLRGRLERKPDVLRHLTDARAQLDDVTGRVVTLRDKVKALNFDPGALAVASTARLDATSAAEQAARTAAFEHGHQTGSSLKRAATPAGRPGQ